MRIERLAEGLTLVKKEDGYYANIELPMYPPDITFLWTRDRDEALDRALDLFNRMKNYK